MGAGALGILSIDAPPGAGELGMLSQSMPEVPTMTDETTEETIPPTHTHPIMLLRR